MANDVDYGDPQVEEAWCEERRAEVASYLRSHKVEHGEIGEWPAWHLPPYVSIWAIESAVTPGAMGWWAICGDLPTDYASSRGLADPREAMRAFAERWRKAAISMQDGRADPETRIGRTPEERKSLAPILEKRAALLARWAEDEELWEDLWDE
jgi:hypothetical protein